MSEEYRFSWNQPVCDACWTEHNPGRDPVRLAAERDTEVCCYCGTETASGIYVRLDPDTVKYPRVEEVGA